jgi:hypothetical protein
MEIIFSPRFWLLFVSWIALMSLNAADAVMTRTALKKGRPELIRFTKDLIDKFGLDGAMLVKVLLPTLLVIIVILGWDTPVFGVVIVEAVFMVLITRYTCVLFHNCRQLQKHNH